MYFRKQTGTCEKNLVEIFQHICESSRQRIRNNICFSIEKHRKVPLLLTFNFHFVQNAELKIIKF